MHCLVPNPNAVAGLGAQTYAEVAGQAYSPFSWFADQIMSLWYGDSPYSLAQQQARSDFAKQAAKSLRRWYGKDEYGVDAPERKTFQETLSDFQGPQDEATLEALARLRKGEQVKVYAPGQVGGGWGALPWLLAALGISATAASGMGSVALSIPSTTGPITLSVPNRTAPRCLPCPPGSRTYWLAAPGVQVPCYRSATEAFVRRPRRPVPVPAGYTCW